MLRLGYDCGAYGAALSAADCARPTERHRTLPDLISELPRVYICFYFTILDVTVVLIILLILSEIHTLKGRVIYLCNMYVHFIKTSGREVSYRNDRYY